MNEATADNNGVYLLDGRHGNGCRQGERERESSSIAVRSVDLTLVLHFFLSDFYLFDQAELKDWLFEASTLILSISHLARLLQREPDASLQLAFIDKIHKD